MNISQGWKSNLKVNMQTRNGNKNLVYDPYLVGLLLTLKLRRDKKWHNMILVTGNVGDGKSNLVEGLVGLNEVLNGKTASMDNVSFATESFIKKIDRTDNFDTSQWWDESIQGAGAKNMAMTAIGDKLKNAFVTKRLKRHTYFLVIDEISEYSWKLIKMCDCWIHVKSLGFDRGFFQCYTKKAKIKYLYDMFKTYKKTWYDKYVQKVRFDHFGTFPMYEGRFIDNAEYTKMKIEETSQILDTDKKIYIHPEMVEAWVRHQAGETYRAIGNDMGKSNSTISDWCGKIRSLGFK